VFLGAGAFYGWPRWGMEEFLIFPLAVLFVSFFALMIVLPSVAVFGGASAFVLAKSSRSALTAATVTAAGGVVGLAIWALIEGDRPGIGICYGAITGLFWYLRFPQKTDQSAADS